MLRYNLTSVLKARGIKNTSVFLRSCGFGENLITRIKLGRSNSLDLRQVEKMCARLKCTPNEIIEWVPSEKDDELPADHPLKTLIHKNDAEEIMQIVHGLSLDKITQVAALVKQIANPSAGQNE